MTRLQRIQSRLTRARNSGDLAQPWRVQFSRHPASYGFNVTGPTACEDTATLIAHAPEDIAYLLAEVARLQPVVQATPNADALHVFGDSDNLDGMQDAITAYRAASINHDLPSGVTASPSTSVGGSPVAAGSPAPDGNRVIVDSADALHRMLDQLNYSGNDCAFPVLNRHEVFYLAFGEDHTGGGEEMFCWLQPADAGAPDFHPVPGYDQCEHCGQRGAIRFELDHTSYPVTAWLNPQQAAAVAHPQEGL